MQLAVLRQHAGAVDDNGGLRIRADPVDAVAEQYLRVFTTRILTAIVRADEEAA